MGRGKPRASVLYGERKLSFAKHIDRGYAVHRAFCPDCGSPVFLVNFVNADVRVLYAGGLEDPGWYQQRMDIYTYSAQP